ncbi:FG-GAP repeat protein [Halapricum desulfuricans]|uniref:Peptidase C1A subfamily n=1 Tax=Halapricum desulfuricans TaxID=2841257 RepID=A0A897P0D9_9EURY|nr:FG-GAP repeat protein [Halapricum desulfuricans]QSG16299.1 Peptidase C1A subfamily [Halapricum desulfuricans]
MTRTKPETGIQSKTQRPSQISKFAADDGESLDFFGRSVAVSSDGTTALIGAYHDDDPNGEDAGSAYVFKL